MIKEPSENIWTSEEIKVWADAGLIPIDLLDLHRQLELYAYLNSNKNTLTSYYHRDYEKDNYQFTIPSRSEWDKGPDIEIVDRKTGTIVQVLEQYRDFQLCEGVTLKVKTKELKDWEQETVNARNFNKEQYETFRETLTKLCPERPLTRKDIVTLIEEIRKPLRKPKKYRQSGHLVDQKLKYASKNSQLSLFDALMPETKQKIEESHLEVKAEGIKLTYAENKLVHALNRLLYEKSQNTDPCEENFYAGNTPARLVPYGLSNNKAIAPVLKFKPAELYKAFMGYDEYSGADVKYAIETLHQLASKKVLIKYDKVKKVKDGNKTINLTDRIEYFQSLIHIVSFIPDLSDAEKSALDKGDNTIRDAKGEIVIALNPIFRDQIDTKFIEFPEDTNRRLVIAAGGHRKVTASMQTLMEYTLREISAKRYKPEINEDKLPIILGLDSHLKQKRNKRIKERISKDIQAITNMGIILKSELVPNAIGGMKWVFTLNKEYE